MDPDSRYRPESWISDKTEEGIPPRPKSKEDAAGHRFRELQRLNRVHGKATWGKRNGAPKIKIRNKIVTILDEEEKMETILETMVIGTLFLVTMWLFSILGFIGYPFVL